jgi:hypothetical protein
MQYRGYQHQNHRSLPMHRPTLGMGEARNKYEKANEKQKNDFHAIQKPHLCSASFTSRPKGPLGLMTPFKAA